MLLAMLFWGALGDADQSSGGRRVDTIDDARAVLETPIASPPPLPPPAPIAPPPPLKPSQVVSPRGNPGNWVITDDYPTRALRESREGTTGFEVTVGVDGRVTACEIIESSGSPDLDAATCDLVTRRARFNPATDRRANPIVGSYSNRVRWVIPVGPPPEPAEFILSFIVGIDGRPVECRSEGLPPGDLSEIEPCRTVPKMEPYTDADGKPVRRRVTLRNTVTVEPAP